MEQFCVLKEPWIPVVDLEGNRLEVGVLECLTNSHQLSCVDCESPLESYAIQRTLMAFLMDAYQLESYRDRRKLFLEGQFDSGILETYVELCRSEGASFDLFDEKRPFMQAGYSHDLDEGKIKPVAILIHWAATGNNHTHFVHGHESRHSLTYGAALRALLASYVFCTAQAQGYPSSVNNTPCNYYLCQGKTLFETLVLNLLSKRENGSIPYSEPMIAWRETAEISPKKEVCTVSVLSAFTWQPRRVTLIPENGKVQIVYYQQGKNFSGNGLWMEPHAGYRKSNKDEWFTVKPQLGRGQWRDVGTLVASNQGGGLRYRPPLCTVHYKKIVREDVTLIPLWVVGLVTNNASLVELQQDKLILPHSLMDEPDLGEVVRNNLEQIEQMARAVFRAFQPVTDSVAITLQSQWFGHWHHVLFESYLPELAQVDPEDAKCMVQQEECFQRKMNDEIRAICNTADTYIGVSGKNLILLEQCKETLWRDYGKLMKKR